MARIPYVVCFRPIKIRTTLLSFRQHMTERYSSQLQVLKMWQIFVILSNDSMKDITDTVNDLYNVLHVADCCYVTKWVTITSALMGQSPIQTVPACDVQIRAHHHIDVFTDIN